MREILFKGKRVYNGEWITSNSIMQTNYSGTFLWYEGCWREVISETVGQYIGLPDKNGKKIFEGDFIRSNSERGYIEYYPSDCAFEVVDDHGFYWFISEMSNIEVIGNIHDNPELSEETK